MIYEAYADTIGSGATERRRMVTKFVLASAAALVLLPLTARAQTSDPAAPTAPLSAAQSANLNQKVAAAEASGAQASSEIVSETFTGNFIGVVDDRSIRVHRDDKKRDETISLYGLQTFGAGSGKDAKSYLADHLKNAHVKVEGRSRDRNGVLFALVTDMPPSSSTVATQTIDGSGTDRDFPHQVDAPSVASTPPTVNYALLRLGLARFDARQLKDAPDLSAAEAAARKEKKGYWANSTDVAAN